jgi:exonuclease SbcC
MRIKNLKIRNLGKHKSVDAILDGAVIGLLGVNGAGKSTILKLIHFVITGFTPPRETQESFIRRVDTELEEAPTQGSIEMIFSAQGSDYILVRKVGTHSSRRLAELDADGNEIKDRTHTKAEDIQTVLCDILGADKYAIDNAVFPGQGELDKMLFGGQSEREELLVKLLLLGHMQKVADVTNGKIKLLAAEITDYSVLQDELQHTRNAAEEELAKLTSILNRSESYMTEIGLFNTFVSLKSTLDDKANSVRTGKTKLAELNFKLKEALKSCGDKWSTRIASSDDIKEWMDKLKRAINGCKNKVKECESQSAAFDELKSLETAQLNANLELDDLGTNRSILYSEEAINNIVKAIGGQTRKKLIIESLPGLKEELTKESYNILNIRGAAQICKETKDKARANLENEIKLLAVVNTVVETCELVHKASCVNCPICSTDLSSVDLNNIYNTNKQAQTDLKIKIKSLNSEIDKCNYEIEELAKQLSRASFNHRRTEDLIADFEAFLATHIDIDIADYEEVLEKCKRSNNEWHKQEGVLSRLKNALADIESKLCKYTKAEKDRIAQIDVVALQRDITDTNVKIISWENTLSEMTEAYATLSADEAVINNNTAQIKDAEILIEQLKTKLIGLEAQFTPRLKSILREENPSDILNKKQQEYMELKTKVDVIKKQTNNIKSRLQEIESKVSLDNDKRKVIQELQTIVTAFSRGGIPMAYVQHKFDTLIALTQENLEIMDANFAIIPNPNKPVSLQFYRVDEPGQVLFEQDKLSGGQRVRVSIAFLLAVQQLIMPELGFLVLDEPSMHLDDESKENLKELLMNIGQQLENTDMQILVCDHAKELEPAFINTIKLYE